MEDLAYRRILDLYYLRESPLPEDAQEVARLIRMRQHADAVRAVLSEFFNLDETGWRHARCDAEIAKASEKREKAKASAAASVSARRAKSEDRSDAQDQNAERPSNERSTNAQRTLSESPADVELPIPRPIPIPIPIPTPEPSPGEGKARKRAVVQAVAKPAEVPEIVWSDFLALRRKKNAPLTETAMREIESQAEKAGLTIEAALTTCCARGWAGFKAKWVEGDTDMIDEATVGKVIDAYSRAYFDRYGTMPVVNGFVMQQAATLVRRIGEDDAPHVAAFYVAHNDAFYVRKGHDMGLLVTDSAKLRMEWATGRQMTGMRARQEERAGSMLSIVDEIARERGELGGVA